MNALIQMFYQLTENQEYFGLLIFIFLAVSMSMLGAYLLIFQGDLLKRRLIRFLPGNPRRHSSGKSPMVEPDQSGIMGKFGIPMCRAILPEKEEDRRADRLRLIRAGFRSKAAYHNYLLIRFLGALLPPLMFLGFSVFNRFSTVDLAWMAGLALGGFFLPAGILKIITLQRQLDMTRALPDALDLMVVCSESGLGLDMTFKRVGEEIRSLSKALSDEFGLTLREIRAGKSRTDSFRNLSHRTGVQELNNLMTILIQASRFGTSMAKALKVHADAMRVKRRQIAEEKAAKVSVKLVFPLVLFIFPALMIVIGGPAFIQIFRLLLPNLAGS
jgi:tight adherence protein C